ncbi:hypothetical protein [Ferrimonas aestuarii]|uniref:Uncharacterized protein n=1 Tax=Ferrimonas aestuarii TaxID=2569539 RepID=A0A4U1BVC7_9GAMM|nr:hypothetical protein [Ferrimonas aestuarii]TKB58424.1 hypothetical protein FCL42_01365 [Ferrimonas aestuarii]
MKQLILLSACTASLLCGCTSNVMNQFELGQTTAQLQQQQVLDPDAARRNAGAVNELSGKVGNVVMTNYNGAASQPKEARGEIREVSLGGGSN